MAKLFSPYYGNTNKIYTAKISTERYDLAELNEQAGALSVEMLELQHKVELYTDGFIASCEELDNLFNVSHSEESVTKQALYATSRRLGISLESFDGVMISREGMIGSIIDGLKKMIAKIIEFFKMLWDKLLKFLGIRKKQVKEVVAQSDEIKEELKSAIAGRATGNSYNVPRPSQGKSSYSKNTDSSSTDNSNPDIDNTPETTTSDDTVESNTETTSETTSETTNNKTTAKKERPSAHNGGTAKKIKAYCKSNKIVGLKSSVANKKPVSIKDIKENTEVIKNEAEIEEVKTKAEELLEKIENKTILNAGLDGKKLGALFIMTKIFRLNMVDILTDGKNSKKVEELLEKSSIGLMMKNMADTMNMYRTSNEGVIQLDSMYRAVHDKSKAALQPWFANQHLNTKGKAHELLSELEKNENSMGVLIVDASVATNSKTNKLGDFVLYSGIGTKLSRDTSEIYIEDDSRNDFAKLISTPIKFNLDSFDNLAKDLEEKKKESGEILKHMQDEIDTVSKKIKENENNPVVKLFYTASKDLIKSQTSYMNFIFNFFLAIGEVAYHYASVEKQYTELVASAE